MSAAWEPVATRGCLDLDVLSAERARRDGLAPFNGSFLLMIVRPDGSGPRPCFSSAELVGTFITEMQPRCIRFLVAEGEDADALKAAIEGRLQ